MVMTITYYYDYDDFEDDGDDYDYTTPGYWNCFCIGTAADLIADRSTTADDTPLRYCCQRTR